MHSAAVCYDTVMNISNRLTSALLALLVLLFGTGLAWRLTHSEPAPEETVNEEPVEETVEEPEVYTAEMFLTGDGLIHGAIYKDAYRIGNGTYDFTGMVEPLRPFVEKYDLKYYNQESMLGGVDLGLYCYPLFNSPQEFGDAMVGLGFNMVSTANNHSLDMGEAGIEKSLAYWNSKEGVINAGTYTSWEDQQALNVYEINGITYTFLSWTFSCNGFYPPQGKEYLVNLYPGREEEMLAQVRKADEISDVVIIAIHWGTEYVHEPNQEQRDMARRLAEAGADIIVGNHPHVIQPVEWIDDTIVFYAMGNMIAAQETAEKQTGMIAGLTITKTVDHGETTVKVSNVRTDLIYTYFANHINFRIYPYEELTDQILPGWEQIYEQQKAIIRMLDDTIPIGGV